MITETQDLEFLGDNVKDTTVTIRSWEFPGHVKVHNALRLFIFASLYPHVRACAPPFSPLKGDSSSTASFPPLDFRNGLHLESLRRVESVLQVDPSKFGIPCAPLHVGNVWNVTVPPFEICHQENFKSRM